MIESKRAHVFLLGSFGTLVVFAVWFLRNTDAFESYVSGHGGLTLFVASIALLIVAAVGGGWALLNGAKSRKAAFSLGLGVPAMVFAIDLGAGTGPDDSAKTADAPHGASTPPGAPAPSAWNGVRAIFSPVGVVRHAERARAERAIDRDLKLTAPAMTGSLVATLKSNDATKRAAAANVLSRMGAEAAPAVKALEDASRDDPDPKVKASARDAAMRIRAVR